MNSPKEFIVIFSKHNSRIWKLCLASIWKCLPDYDNIPFIQYNVSWVSFDEKKRHTGDEFVTKLGHWPLTFSGHAHVSCPIDRNQSLKRQGLKALAFDKKVPPGKDLNWETDKHRWQTNDLTSILVWPFCKPRSWYSAYIMLL